jgi:uncharacterized repeat protein (TIGR01451 family)
VTAVSGGASVSLANGTTIPAGGCSISVDVTVPPTAVSGTNTNNIPAGTLQTSVGNNQAPANATLTVSALGYVSGRVFADNNVTPDGIYQLATDSPLTGVSLALYSGANCGGVLVGTTTTDSLGNYLFLGLAAGTYSVCQAAQPTGTVNGATSAGALVSNAGSTGTAGAAGNPTATSSQIAGIVLNGDGTDGAVSGSTNNNFAEIVPSSIAGTVYLDQNNNGVQNGADAGISGITIELLNSVGSVIQTTTTDANGNYRFAGLDPGTYSVREPTQPPATSNGITTPGSVSNGGTTGTASGITTAPSQISNIVLPPNTTASGNNFGEIPNGRSVSGQVFLDYNANGVNNGTPEHGIGGQTVTLTGNDINGNPVSATTVTDSDGSYRFTGLPEGSNYTVIQATQPAGTTNGLATAGSTGGSASNPTASSSQISGINLVGGNTVSANNDFAEVPGAAPDLAIAKTHSPASFAESGNTGFYTITPSNLGTVDTSGAISIVDTLPTGITLAATAIGNGWTCSGAAGASVVSCTTNAVIAAGSSGSTIILRVAVAAGLSGQVLTNTAVISGGSEPAGFDGNNTATDPVVIATAAAVQGHVWLDLSHSRRFSDAQSVPQAGWTVELKLNGNLVSSTTTDTAGAYAFNGLAPGSGYQIRFRHPTTGQIFGNARPNETDATYTSGVVDANNPAGAVTTDGTLKGLTFLSGTTTLEQSLPVDPAGVVYDAVTRQPVAGAVITIGGPPGFDPAVHLVGGNPAVTTGTDGLYQFLLAQGAPSGTYVLTTTTYPGGYMPSPSTMIPVCTASLAVGATPDPALVQTSNTPPGTGVTAHNPAACPGIPAGAVTTQYYSSFVITAGVSASVVNNHIPLDPILGGAIVMTKTTPMTTISKGGLIPYTVTATNTLSATLTNINIVDRIPPGFRYRSGSASLNGLVFEPTVSGRDLNWLNQTFTAGERKTIKMILVVGAGVGEGEYVNQAWSVNSIVSSLVSNVATATVRVIPDPTFDCSDIIGKVFDDKNANGYQDDGEPGIPNVRVVTARGLLVTADADGRFHVPCAAIPQIDHGSNFVMKLDERTLPSGYRLTTENPRDVRVTRGKMVKLNFGATVHRVVRLELTPTAFTVGDELDPQWVAKLDAVVEQLKGRPSVLRIAYAGVGDQSQVRVDRVAERIRMLWKNHEKEKDKKVALPPLIIETELEGAQ